MFQSACVNRRIRIGRVGLVLVLRWRAIWLGRLRATRGCRREGLTAFWAICCLFRNLFSAIPTFGHVITRLNRWADPLIRSQRHPMKAKRAFRIKMVLSSIVSISGELI